MKTDIQYAVRTWFAAIVLMLISPIVIAQGVAFDALDKSPADQSFTIDNSSKLAFEQSSTADTFCASTSPMTGKWTGILTQPSSSPNVWQAGMMLTESGGVVSGSRYTVAGNESVTWTLQGTVAGNQFTFADIA